jgi:hypothetical protein
LHLCLRLYHLLRLRLLFLHLLHQLWKQYPPTERLFGTRLFVFASRYPSANFRFFSELGPALRPPQQRNPRGRERESFCFAFSFLLFGAGYACKAVDYLQQLEA